MAADEFFLALNPDPTKQSVRIEKAKYDVIHEAILDNLLSYGPMTWRSCGRAVAKEL